MVYAKRERGVEVIRINSNCSVDGNKAREEMGHGLEKEQEK